MPYRRSVYFYDILCSEKMEVGFSLRREGDGMMERVEALFLFATLLLLFFVDRGSPKLFEILIWNDLDLYNIINSHAILYTLKFGRLNLYLVISGL